MTGTNRLRTLAGAWDVYGLGGALGDIARQIDRERACDADTIENVRLIVGGVVDEMERHVSGVEGAEDSPVARWACELRRALKSDASDSSDGEKPSCANAAEAPGVTSEAPKVTRDPAEDVSMSAYDLLPKDEREAVAWVRDSGGLDAVKRRWECLSYYADPVPRAYAEKRIAKRQRQIDESHAALRRRNERIAELERRLSEAVSAQLASDSALYDMRRELRDVCEVNGVEPGEDPLRAMERHVESLTDVVDNLRLMLNARAMPGGIKWPRWDDGELLTHDDAPDDAIGIFLALDGSCWATMTDVPDDCHEAGERVKRPAHKVLDADGAEIRVGDKLYYAKTGCSCIVRAINADGTIELDGHENRGWHADRFAHRAPVLDADGAEIDVGDDLYSVEGSLKFHVSHVDRINGKIATDAMFALDKWADPAMYTHRAPVLAADGRPLREGEAVWSVDSGTRYTVEKITDGIIPIQCRSEMGSTVLLHPSQLTHERPESWERLEDDAESLRQTIAAQLGDYDFDESGKDSVQTRLMDLVRRARALAERGE